MPRDVVTVEFYSTIDPERLLGAVDLPRKRAEDGATAVGRAICKAVNADSLNAIMIAESGDVIERMLICRK